MAAKSISRMFSRHGHFCVCHSWEVTVLFMGIVACLFSVTGAPKNSPAEWIMMNDITPAQIHVETTHNCVTPRTSHSHCPPVSQMEDKKPTMEAADIVVMTIIRSIALLYGYHQLRTLKRMGTRRVLGLTTVFAVFAGFAFTSAAHLLHEEIAELREALLYFLLILDLPKACLLAKIALHSSKTARSLPRSYKFKAHIIEGIVLLGPSLTLDTFLELFVLTIGILSGVRRLQILCSFASLSVIINYIVFMTVYPASLYIILELFKKRIQRRDRDSAYRANPSEKSIAAIQENIYQVHNTMLQRAKIGIAVALVIIHSYGRWPYFTDTNGGAEGANTDSFGTSPGNNILVSDGRSSEIHLRPSQQNGTKDTEAYSYLLKWISVSLDQLVVFVLTAVLAVRYFFFEDKLDTDNRNPLQVSQQQQSSSPPTLVKESDTSIIVTSSPSSCNKEKETPVQIVLPTTTTSSLIHPVTMSTVLSQPLLNLQVSNKIQMDNKIEKNSSACSFRIGESDSDSENSENDDTKGSNVLLNASNVVESTNTSSKSVQTLEMGIEKETSVTNNTNSKIMRSIQDCLAIYKSEDGAKGLSDEEVIALVNTKHIPAYQLEKAVDDAERGVAIRRKIIGKTSGIAGEGLSNELPYKNYDYSKVMGACCENVIGYIPVPVGVAGPLKLDGTVYQVPMATTEGCLVASTNRGCRALQNGIRSRVVHDGMSRAPIVRFPNAIRASEAMLWLTDEDNFQIIKSSFDSSSRFARLQKVHCRIAGRYLFIRFVAKTGDAMGMNMISKGTEVALNTMQEIFCDMEILSLSGNVCTDKKPAAINWIEGRGKSVVAEAVVPAHIVENVLKTSVAALVELNIAKNLVGSAMAGSIGGFNAHAANIVTAIYIATGQDPAQNVGSSNCMTLMEPWGENGKDLFISCSMPSMEIGTVGGGTILGAQSACLEMLGVKGANSSNPGENARTLARIVCGTVLAGELSLMSALAAGHLVRSHLKHNRSSTNVEANSAKAKSPTSSSVKEVIQSEIPVCKNKPVPPMQRLVGLTKRHPLANSSLTPQSVTMDFLSLPECKQA